ncbi:unnamed protein product [Symbiodinium necroappetens]|uniref:DUF202 domain-containing protein n=1 Tax=Symbiodinium necroappetens TaxID=1628268 RepID=A0A812KSC7_9DINO|nr:unnamed protein product [Symbiodinium necroappetens]CAE7863849.1 unnamed protein product [Symbiodinium microadriaticum]CAE7948307.1 unnamed protein product [Symbiodinium sp. KB8]
MPTVKVEPKVWFSTERTFIHWAKLSTVFAATAAVMMASSRSAATDVCGLVVGSASLVLLFHACLKQWKRNRIFKSGGKQYVRVEEFADRFGAILLACSLTTVVFGLVAIPAVGL